MENLSLAIDHRRFVSQHSAGLIVKCHDSVIDDIWLSDLHDSPVYSERVGHSRTRTLSPNRLKSLYAGQFAAEPCFMKNATP